MQYKRLSFAVSEFGFAELLLHRKHWPPPLGETIKMSKKPPAILNTISTKQMKDVIQKSGYLLEQRVESILTKEGYFVQTNPAFLDPETGKSREIDINALRAIRVYKKGDNFVFPTLLCECENNLQPIVFFTKESPVSFLHYEEVKVSGVPVKFWQEDGYIGLPEFTGMQRFHHYCEGAIATQYCTFQLKKDKSSWMAFHSEEQHGTFDSIIKDLEYEIAKHFDGWVLPDKTEEEMVNIQIYYPLLILQSGLYCGSLKNNRLALTKSKHVQFRKEFFLPRTNEVNTYQIDVISEKYLLDYLKIIESEILKVKKVFQQRRQKARLSIEKIVEEAKRVKEKRESYREYLEYK
jgi:hypothetical protein